MQEEFDKVAKKFSLPSFEELDYEFEISTLEKEFLLRNIKRRVEDKLTYLAQLLSDIIQPNTESLASLYECNHFSEEEKEEILKIVRVLQYQLRALAESYIAMDDTADAKLITEITKEFPHLRKQSLPLVAKLKEVWKIEQDFKEVLEYLG